MPRAAKAKEPIPLSIPPADTAISRWIVLGLDPSMSRTGFALMDVRLKFPHSPEDIGERSDAIWLAAGSVKPDKIEDASGDARSTVWIRAKAIATYIREMVKSVAPQPKPRGDLEG